MAVTAWRVRYQRVPVRRLDGQSNKSGAEEEEDPRADLDVDDVLRRQLRGFVDMVAFNGRDLGRQSRLDTK